MTTKRRKKVDAIDALSAIADFVEHMRRHKITIHDLAINLGWTNSRTEDFLFGGDIPTYDELLAVSKELGLKLDF